jgi:hypothetical protein
MPCERAGLPPDCAGLGATTSRSTRKVISLQRVDATWDIRTTIWLTTEGDPLKDLAFVITSPPAKGTLTCNKACASGHCTPVNRINRIHSPTARVAVNISRPLARRGGQSLALRRLSSMLKDRLDRRNPDVAALALLAAERAAERPRSVAWFLDGALLFGSDDLDWPYRRGALDYRGPWTAWRGVVD